MKQLVFFCLILLSVGFISAQQPVLLRNAQYLGFEGTHLALPNGATMIFWNDTSSGSSDVLAQKISSAGAVLWSAPRAVALSALEERVLSAILTSDHNILVHFRSYSPMGDLMSQRVQKFSQAGQPLWGEQGILIPGQTSYSREACLVPNAIGGAYVIYKAQYPSTEVFGMNLDNFGTNLWPQLPLCDYSGLSDIEAVEDGFGGLIINCKVYVSGGQTQNRVLRFDAAGDVLGSNPLLNPTAVVPPGFSILPDSQGNYLLYLFQADGLSVQKMDVNGNLLLPGLVTIACTSPIYTGEYVLKAASGGGFVFLYLLYSYANGSGLVLHNLDSNLQNIWAQPVQIEVPNQVYRCHLDVSNGIWLSWLQQVPSNFNDNTVYCARVEAGGNLAFAPVAVSNDQNFKQFPILKSAPNQALVIWNDRFEEQIGIRAQILSNSGSLQLEPGGRDVYGVLNGSTELKKMHKSGNNYLHIYEDSRFNESSRLYLQLSQAGGEPVLETDGKPLNPGSDFPETYLDSKQTANNTTMLLYMVFGSDQRGLWLQEIDSAGSILWPGYGIAVASGASADFSGSQLGQIGNDIVVVWPQWLSGSNSQSLWGQRFSAGIAQWQAGGKLLTGGENAFKVAKAMQGDYLIYYEEHYNLNTVTIKALKLDGDGNPAAGWPQGGVSMNSAATYFARYLHSGVVHGDLVVFSSSTDQSYELSTYVQKFSSSAQPLWGEDGLLLAESSDWFQLNINDAVYDNEITWLEQDTESYRVSLKRINQAGEFLWGETGCVLNASGPDWQDAKLARFANGSLAVFHTSYLDGQLMSLKRQDVSALGSLISPEAIALVSNRQYLANLNLNVNQNSGLISWNSYVSYELKRGDAISLSSLWTCRFDADPTALEDPLIPQPLHSISSYPNPFRENATISFGLKAASPVKVDIYNLKGQHVRSLLDEAKTSGDYQLQWDAKDEQGNRVSAGIYLYKIQAGKFSSSKKMILLK